jgi:hypothetical protein
MNNPKTAHEFDTYLRTLAISQLQEIGNAVPMHATRDTSLSDIIFF